MIRSFKGRWSELLIAGYRPRGFPAELVRAAQRKLLELDAAVAIGDIAVRPGNRIEKLSGDRKGQWAMRVNDQWRICFFWKSDGAHDVEVVDYHR